MTLLASWPTVVDDDGTKTFGTRFEKALTDAIKASVEDNLHSLTNSTIKTKTIIDEVVAARGSSIDLVTRLNVTTNADGTPKSVAGQATNSDLQSQIGSRNVILNGDLNAWTNGSALAPDEFTLAGAGGTIAQTGPAMGDTFTFGTGTYAAKITRAGTNVTLTNTPISAADMPGAADYKGKKVVVLMKGLTAIASHLRLVVDDGVTTTASTYHTGNGSAQLLTVTHPISALATKLAVYASVENSNGAAYVGGFMVVFSNLEPTAWTPLSSLSETTQTVMGLIKIGDIKSAPKYRPGSVATADVTVSGRVTAATNVTPVGNIGVGTDTLMTGTVTGNTLSADGKIVRITAGGTWGTNANNKSVLFTWGALPDITIINAASPNGGGWKVIVDIIRTGAATQIIGIIAGSQNAAGGANTGYGNTNTVATETLSANVAFSFKAIGTNNDDISQKYMFVEVLG